MSAGTGGGDAGQVAAAAGAPAAAAARETGKQPAKRTTRRSKQPVYSQVTEYENYAKLSPIGTCTCLHVDKLARHCDGCGSLFLHFTGHI